MRKQPPPVVRVGADGVRFHQDAPGWYSATINKMTGERVVAQRLASRRWRGWRELDNGQGQIRRGTSREYVNLQSLLHFWTNLDPAPRERTEQHG